MSPLHLFVLSCPVVCSRRTAISGKSYYTKARQSSALPVSKSRQWPKRSQAAETVIFPHMPVATIRIFPQIDVQRNSHPEKGKKNGRPYGAPDLLFPAQQSLASSVVSTSSLDDLSMISSTPGFPNRKPRPEGRIHPCSLQYVNITGFEPGAQEGRW